MAVAGACECCGSAFPECECEDRMKGAIRNIWTPVPADETRRERRARAHRFTEALRSYANVLPCVGDKRAGELIAQFLDHQWQ